MSSICKERNASSSSSSISHASDSDVSKITTPSDDSSSTTSSISTTSDVEFKHSAEDLAGLEDSLYLDSPLLHGALIRLVETFPDVAASFVPKILQMMSTDAEKEKDTIMLVGLFLVFLAKREPSVLLPNFCAVFDYCLQMVKKGLDDDRFAAITVFLLCANSPTLVPASLERDIAAAFVHMCERGAEDASQSMNDDDDGHKGKSIPESAARARSVMEIGNLSSIIYKMIECLQDHQEWKNRFAAVQLLPMCGWTQKIVEAAIRSLKDPHAAVRYEAVDAIRIWLCLDANLLLNDNAVLPALVATLSDPVARVAAASAAAIGDSLEKCPKGIAIDYRTHLMTALMNCLEGHFKLLFDEGKSGMLCQIMGTITSLGEANAKLSIDCCDKLMEMLKAVIRRRNVFRRRIDQSLYCKAKACLLLMVKCVGEERLIEAGFTEDEVKWSSSRVTDPDLGCLKLDDEEKDEKKKECDEKKEGEGEEEEKKDGEVASRPQRIRRPVERLVVDPSKKKYESKSSQQ